MSSRSRVCRDCGERFDPVRFDQGRCGPCSNAERDAELIEKALRRAPGRSVDWVAAATGVPADRIRELAAAGRLPVSPGGADIPAQCTCPPGDEGHCRYCRAQLARRFAEARYEAAREVQATVARGMRMRRG
jgi:hypothetical protein